jgi:hypothetical protein
MRLEVTERESHQGQRALDTGGNANPDKWKIEGGILTGTGYQVTALVTRRTDYKNFRLRTEIMLEPKSNALTIFRGYEQQNDPTKGGVVGGYNIVPFGYWFLVSEDKLIKRLSGKLPAP